MRIDADVEVGAGYRDVAMNLQIRNAETSELAVEHHVCEVQLILVQFANPKVHPHSPVPVELQH